MAWGGAFLLLILSGCGIDRAGLGFEGASDGGGRADAGPGTADAGRDATTPAGRDASADAAVEASTDAGPPPDPFCGDDTALVLCLTFEGDLADGSAYGHDGIGDVNWGEGAVGMGAVLDSASSLRVRHSGALTPSLLSMELWVRPDAVPTTGRAGLVDKNGQYGLFVYAGGEVRCTSGGLVGGRVAVPGALAGAAWTHVACVYDGSAMRLYLDGALAEEVAVSGTVSLGSADLHVGEDSPSGGDQLVGRIDELRVWHSARTPAQVAASAARRVARQ